MEKEKSNKRRFGSVGEGIAVEYLAKNGYSIIERNYRVGKIGEVDIIAQENEYLCFIEVKTRSSMLFGTPSEAVNRKKQECIKRLAMVYINQHDLQKSNIRFDIVEILMNKDKKNFINLIRNSF